VVAPATMAESLRSSPEYLSLPPLFMQEKDFSMDSQPVLSQQRYVSRPSLQPIEVAAAEPR